MNEREAAQVIAVLQINYPDSFRDKSAVTVKATVALWAEIFKDDPYEAVMAAVKAHIATDTNRFMPPVGVIKNKLVQIMNPEMHGEMEAWYMVMKAVRRSYYHAEEEFHKLPKAIQRTIGGASQLRDWSQLEDSSMPVIQSNFMRSYRAVVKAETEKAALPQTLRDMLQGFQYKQIGDGGAT